MIIPASTSVHKPSNTSKSKARKVTKAASAPEKRITGIQTVRKSAPAGGATDPENGLTRLEAAFEDLIITAKANAGLSTKVKPNVDELKGSLLPQDPWQPGETPFEAWEKKANEAKWKGEKRTDEYNAEIGWPTENRLKRAYNMADAEHHGLHDAVAQVVAAEIINLRLVEPGPYPLNWLNDVLKRADIPTSMNLSIGFHLARTGLGTSREWKIQSLKEISDWTPRGFEFHYRASMLASFRPLPNLSEAESFLKDAGYSEENRTGILKAFEGVAMRISNRK
jgi:hypothetical protein